MNNEGLNNLMKFAYQAERQKVLDKIQREKRLAETLAISKNKQAVSQKYGYELTSPITAIEKETYAIITQMGRKICAPLVDKYLKAFKDKVHIDYARGEDLKDEIQKIDGIFFQYGLVTNMSGPHNLEISSFAIRIRACSSLEEADPIADEMLLNHKKWKAKVEDGIKIAIEDMTSKISRYFGNMVQKSQSDNNNDIDAVSDKSKSELEEENRKLKEKIASQADIINSRNEKITLLEKERDFYKNTALSKDVSKPSFGEIDLLEKPDKDEKKLNESEKYETSTSDNNNAQEDGKPELIGESND